MVHRFLASALELTVGLASCLVGMLVAAIVSLFLLGILGIGPYEPSWAALLVFLPAMFLCVMGFSSLGTLLMFGGLRIVGLDEWFDRHTVQRQPNWSDRISAWVRNFVDRRLPVLGHEARRRQLALRGFRVTWRVFTDANTESEARLVAKQVLEKLKAEGTIATVEPDRHSGFVCSLMTLPHTVAWSGMVVEVLSVAQQVGRGWKIDGDALEGLDAWCHDAAVDGVNSIHVCARKEE